LGTLALALGYGCLAFYDAFSKRLTVALIADTVRAPAGPAWSGTARYAAVAAAPPPSSRRCSCRVCRHRERGARRLRDLANDSARGARTAAIAFGARVVGDGVTVRPGCGRSPGPCRARWALLAVASPFGVRGGFGLWFLSYLVGLATTAAAVLLLREGLRSADRPARFLNIGAAHILCLWLPLTAMTAMYGGFGQGLVSLAAMAVPMLGNDAFRTAFAALPGVVTDIRAAVGRELTALRERS